VIRMSPSVDFQTRDVQRGRLHLSGLDRAKPVPCDLARAPWNCEREKSQRAEAPAKRDGKLVTQKNRGQEFVAAPPVAGNNLVAMDRSDRLSDCRWFGVLLKFHGCLQQRLGYSRRSDLDDRMLLK